MFNKTLDSLLMQSGASISGGGSSGGGGGGGSRGGGVGVSTGSYLNTTQFKYVGNGMVEITAHSTRLVHLNMPDSEKYRAVVVNNNDVTAGAAGKGNMVKDDAHYQMVTPWSLVDCNAWGVWFNPGDWQLIVNQLESLELVSLEQDVFNVVLKTVTQQSSDPNAIKLYNNDLTASLLVALDSNNVLPFTPAAIRSETLGFLPWQPTIPTQWRYYLHAEHQVVPSYSTQTNNPTQTFNRGAESVQFYPVESLVPIEMLRTGDEFSTGTYYFDCDPIPMTYSWQTNRSLGLPPKIENMPSTTTENGTLLAQDQRLGMTQDLQNLITEVNIIRPVDIGYDTPWRLYSSGQQGAFRAPVLPADTVTTDVTPESGSIRMSYGGQHGTANPTTIDRYNIVAENHQGRRAATEWLQTAPSNQAFAAATRQEVLLQGDRLVADVQAGNSDVGLLQAVSTYGPFTAFNGIQPTYPQGQIWDKQVGTQYKPRLHLNAPFVCKNNAPGQLLVKIAPNLTEEFSPTSATFNRIVTYSDFWWRGTLTLRGKLRSNHQWNTIPQWSLGANELRPTIPNNQGEHVIPVCVGGWKPRKIY
ncbi:VP2 [Fox parvovirus]|nr:VP2 [Fox parvovirus]AGK45549.1 VP2 [Fox parvovirus]